ncbi:type II toxin-antitoxin system VapC family toxin [Cuspidothrix issatschenkoi LEGE 03284]|uniref:type II toxin-antitoxin system VapC family toxin n=1 Tax=Cuspidothrix issatschenkoi TaxID=230752 RepID=UPI0018823609|nr:type II toxin-antitoxin system VapC family toxin [Cuspidothrix issatschenkoi]MBE9231276.1 type II toxin-antitoxin system VapC family toxin [Cuspidothrix issatschenkoi LEGE 03284]
MKFLLDTHSLIWFFSGHPNLSDTARKLIEDIEQQKLISLASVWEMGIKQSKGKLTLSLALEDYIREKTLLDDFALLPINLNHLGVITSLPFHHNDPFDRLLIAQAITDNIPILTRDIAFDNYNINRIWD